MTTPEKAFIHCQLAQSERSRKRLFPLLLSPPNFVLVYCLASMGFFLSKPPQQAWTRISTWRRIAQGCTSIFNATVATRKSESRAIEGIEKKKNPQGRRRSSHSEKMLGREGQGGAFFLSQLLVQQGIRIKGTKKRLPGSDGEGVADGGISKQDDLASLMPQDLYRKQHTSDRSLNVASLAAYCCLSTAS